MLSFCFIKLHRYIIQITSKEATTFLFNSYSRFPETLMSLSSLHYLYSFSGLTNEIIEYIVRIWGTCISFSPFSVRTH